MSSQPKTYLETAIHNALLHPSTLVIAAIAVAIGFAATTVGLNQISTFDSILTFNVLLPIIIGGILLSFGFIMAFSQQYLAYALMGAYSERSTITIAALLWTAGQIFVGLSQTLFPQDPLAGSIAGIIGYVLIVISIVLSGSVGVQFTKVTVPNSPTGPPAR